MINITQRDGRDVINRVSTLIEVNNLKTWFPVRRGILSRTIGHVRAVDGISFALNKGETIGLVGESGCGKSVTAHSIIRLIPEPPGKIVHGKIRFDGTDLLSLSEAQMRKIRGNRISMIF
ncbi:MAG: ATP-binding cassette domain-containing protein, partial [Desulfobacterales bacterium]|nr:ATP-binding cassette domain-containing protein [Desulfobacterales bacterium]MDX2513510.1 ATP-binding cassette domain-containing protein [Desulfobacterales bacterium]